jgi:lipoate synthase
MAWTVGPYTDALIKAGVPRQAFHELDAYRPKTVADAMKLRGVGNVAIKAMLRAGLLEHGDSPFFRNVRRRRQKKPR